MWCVYCFCVCRSLFWLKDWGLLCNWWRGWCCEIFKGFCFFGICVVLWFIFDFVGVDLDDGGVEV